MRKTQAVTPYYRQRRQSKTVSVFFNTKLNRFVSRRYPTKPWKDTPARKAQREEWMAVIKANKLATGEDVKSAYHFSKGTNYVPRDLLMLASYGKIMRVHEADGTAWDSARIAQLNIQQLLNSITDVEGSIVFRGPTLWWALSPGAAGQVLTFDGTTGWPDWQDPSGGGGGLAVAAMPATFGTTIYTAGGACKGNACKAVADIPLSGVIARYNRASTTPATELTAGLYIVDEATMQITDVLAESDPLSVPAVNGYYTYALPFNAGKVTVPAGSVFVLAVRRTDSGDTSNWGSMCDGTSHANPFPGLPITDVINGSVTSHFGVTLAKKAPAVGDTFSTFGYNVGIGAQTG